MVGSKMLSSKFENFLGRGQNSCVDMFSRDADCQLGGEGSQENVSIVSARGEGVPKWAFLASADIWTLPNQEVLSRKQELIYFGKGCCHNPQELQAQGIGY